MADIPGALNDLGHLQGQAPSESKGFGRPGESAPTVDYSTMERVEKTPTPTVYGRTVEREPYDEGRPFDGGVHKPGAEKQRAQEERERSGRAAAALSRREKAQRAYDRQLEERAAAIRQGEAALLRQHGKNFELGPESYTARERALQERQNIAKWDAKTTEAVSADPARWEYLNKFHRQGEVAELRRQYFQATKVLLSVEDAADSVEEYVAKQVEAGQSVLQTVKNWKGRKP